jgi:hypothetical protein
VADDPSFQIVDPEEEDKNEKFSVALMGATSGMICGLVVVFVGLVGGIMSDQRPGLSNVGIGMGVFAIFALVHLAISRRWLGGTGKDMLQANLAFFLFAALGGALYFYASYSDTEWLAPGFLGGILFVGLLGKGILSIERPPLKSRRTTYIFSPFERNSILIVVLVGTILGIGVGMNGHRAIGRGPFARTFLAEKIAGAHHEVNILVFGLPKSYRLQNALREAKKKGIALRMLATRETAIDYPKELLSLRDAGIPTRILPSHLPSFIHPFVVIDHRILLTGSGGWGSRTQSEGHQMRMTANLLSLGKIRETGKNFDSLWQESTPFASPAPSSQSGIRR